MRQTRFLCGWATIRDTKGYEYGYVAGKELRQFLMQRHELSPVSEESGAIRLAENPTVSQTEEIRRMSHISAPTFSRLLPKNG
jgi:hypothetical protein